MRTVTYKSVLDRATTLLTNKATPTTDDNAALNIFINSRYREYFERFFFPELTPCERRTFRQPFDGTLPYLASTATAPVEVFYWPTQSYYQCLRDATVPVSVDYDQLLAVITSANPHDLQTGDRVQLSGVSPAVYNGTFTITVIDSNRFTYPLASDPGNIGLGTPVCVVHPAGATGEVNPAYWGVSAAAYNGSDWSLSTAYTVGSIVYQPQDGRYYQCVRAHTNVAPPDVTYWGVLTEFVRNIDYVEGNQGSDATSLGEVKDVWDANPRVDETACRIEFTLTDDGVIVRGTETVVWVEFRLRPNDFTGTVWVLGTTYAVDAQVYYTTTGEYYRALQAVTASQVPTATTHWEKLDFPYVLAPAVSQAAYADQLKVTGKTSKWTEEIRESLRLLQREFDKIERQQGQVRCLQVASR